VRPVWLRTRLAVARGHAHAQRNLGDLYAVGDGVPRDFAEAARLYALAAARCLAAAPCELGRVRARGAAPRKLNRRRAPSAGRRGAGLLGGKCQRRTWAEHTPRCKGWDVEASGEASAEIRRDVAARATRTGDTEFEKAVA
jgi:TPR repeat protein